MKVQTQLGSPVTPEGSSNSKLKKITGCEHIFLYNIIILLTLTTSFVLLDNRGVGDGGVRDQVEPFGLGSWDEVGLRVGFLELKLSANGYETETGGEEEFRQHCCGRIK